MGPGHFMLDKRLVEPIDEEDKRSVEGSPP